MLWSGEGRGGDVEPWSSRDGEGPAPHHELSGGHHRGNAEADLALGVAAGDQGVGRESRGGHQDVGHGQGGHAPLRQSQPAGGGARGQQEVQTIQAWKTGGKKKIKPKLVAKVELKLLISIRP